MYTARIGKWNSQAAMRSHGFILKVLATCLIMVAEPEVYPQAVSKRHAAQLSLFYSVVRIPSPVEATSCLVILRPGISMMFGIGRESLRSQRGFNEQYFCSVLLRMSTVSGLHYYGLVFFIFCDLVITHQALK